ncbi:MAG: hypothetical protein WCG08_12830 [Paludibacter sp.]
MKSTEEYINDYNNKLNELSSKGEEWRIRVTQEEFLTEIERIREYENRNANSKELNEYHIQRNVKAMISVMLMDGVTIEEAREQTARLKKDSEKYFAEEVPEIIQRLKLVKTPLSFRNTVNIYKWLWRKQITLEMISEDVLIEFSKTQHYKKLIERDEENSI